MLLVTDEELHYFTTGNKSGQSSIIHVKSRLAQYIKKIEIKLSLVIKTIGITTIVSYVYFADKLKMLVMYLGLDPLR